MNNIISLSRVRKIKEKKQSEYEAKVKELTDKRQRSIESMTDALLTCNIDKGTMHILLDFTLAMLSSSNLSRLEEKNTNKKRLQSDSSVKAH